MDIDGVAEEWYGLTPGAVHPCTQRARQGGKAGGDKGLAAQIVALRKPSVLAWLANSLARERRNEIDAMLDLGEALREASATLSGPELRELSRQLHQLVYAMVQQGRALAGETGRRVTDDVARGLEETLTAALTSAEDGELLRRARLTEGLVPRGFPVAATTAPPKTPMRQVGLTRAAAPARAKGPSTEERRLAQRKERLQRDLVAATTLAKQKSTAQEETAAAFGESQRTL